MPSKPPATFATRSQPVTPAAGELWSPPSSHGGQTTSNSFAMDIFGFSKDPISPPVDPFKSSSSSSTSSKDIFDPFQSTTSQVATTVISPPPNVQAKSSAHDFADFDSAFGGSAPEVPPLTACSQQPAPTLLPLQPTDAAAPKADEPKSQVPQADRYAALAALDELFSGQVRQRNLTRQRKRTCDSRASASSCGIDAES